MKTYAYLVTMYAILATLFLGLIAVDHMAGPKSGLPEDRYRFYLGRADELHQQAERALAESQGQEYWYNLDAEKLARSYAAYWRDEFNKQLQVRLYRALAITGDPKMFQAEYDGQKLL